MSDAEFEAWFADWADPHVGKVELMTQKVAAHAAWRKARAMPLAAVEPVLWVESEPSARLLDLSEVIQGTCHTVMYHRSEPRTSNPVWPLYTGTLAAPDRAPSTDSATEEAKKRAGYVELNRKLREAGFQADSATERDAARYRFLRDNGVGDDEGYASDALLVYKGFGESSLLPDELDSAVDRAIAAMKGEAHE